LRSLPIPFVPGPDLYDLVLSIKKSQGDLDTQVTEAIESLQKTTELIAQLENGVKYRADKLTKLRAEYERYSTLAEVEADKAAALIKQIEITMGKGQRREHWVTLGLNVLAGLIVFVAGVLLADPLKSLLSAAWTAVFGQGGASEKGSSLCLTFVIYFNIVKG